jgi:hypothetical protein
MSKIIKVVIQTQLELPNKAEIIRFTDEDEIATDHIKMAGKLFRPSVCWLQYMTTDLHQKKYGKKWGRGMGWQSVDDKTSMKHFQFPENEHWYMEVEEG